MSRLLKKSYGRDAIGEVPAEEKHPFLREWKATRASSHTEVCVHHLFEAQAARTPSAEAVVAGTARLTYAELNTRANQLARYLGKLGAGPGSLVAVTVDRSTDMLTALLGVLKTGAAYIPLDPAFPRERLALMLEDARPAVVLTKQALRGALPFGNGEVVCLDADWPRIARESVEKGPDVAVPDDLAYVIFTSGSTGKPKGVMVPHRAVVSFLISMQCQPGLTARDTLLGVTTLSFDIAGLECFLPLTVGARLVVASHDETSDGNRLLELLKSSGATVMQATPATWRLMLEAGWQAGERTLKILCGGEALPGALAGPLLERCGALWNMYGPTETTIWSTLHRVVSDADATTPIGQPIANTQVYTLDARLEPVPAGEAGELFIGGVGVARGYFNRPGLTAEKFVPDPFSPVPGARLYRAGDLARFRSDGILEFLGRIDHQVKIRGFRIELGDVEAALSLHPAVREVVVLAREDVPGDQRLVAYVVVKPPQGVTADELRHLLRAKLPEYMIPSAYVTLEAMPRTPNGKINRRALPPPEPEWPSLKTGFVAPRSPLESRLSSIWEEVLGIQPISVKDSLFDLGVHSLLLARLAARLQREFSKKEAVALLIEAPTIEQLAERLRGEQAESRWTSLVLLKSGGTGLPFFCVHGGMGTVFLLRRLAATMGSGRPIYGLQARAWHEDSPPHTSIEEMAAHYVQELRRVQPNGPYLLGGYCFGGIVAFEMAQQLLAAGEKVALIASLNAPNPAAVNRFNGPQSTAGSPGERLRSFSQRFLAVRLARKVVGCLLRTGKSLPVEARRFLVTCRIQLHRTLGRSLPPELRSRLLQRISNRAEKRYVPRAYPGTVAVFRGDRFDLDPYLGKDPELGWGELSLGHLDVFEVPGSGEERRDLLEEPCVRHLAEQLTSRLDQAETEHRQNGRR